MIAASKTIPSCRTTKLSRARAREGGLSTCWFHMNGVDLMLLSAPARFPF
jgi:hypothetical protein